MQVRGWLPWCAATLAALCPSIARAELSPEDRQVIDRRLVKVVDEAPSLTIEEGDTILVERREVLSKARFTKKPGDYEGTVSIVASPRGVVVHPRLDDFKLEPQGPEKMQVTLRYAIHVDPGTSSGGRVQLLVVLTERTGLANTVLQTKLAHTVNVVPPKVKAEDLAADFQGYRLYKKLASDRLVILQSRGLRELAIADQGRVPSLERATTELSLATYEFERYRRRTWVAHRHLITASKSKDPKIAQAARAYLDNLDKPDGQLTGLPEIGLGGKKAEVAQKEEPKVERLKPERVEDVKGGGGGGGGTLNPVSTYEPGSEGDDDEPINEPPPKKDEPKDTKPKTPAKPGTPDQGPKDGAKDGKKTDGGELSPAGQARLEEDILEGRRGREIPIPSYGRGLVLDDPNVGFGFAVRSSYATVNLRGSEGTTPAIFFSGQVAVTRAFGIELTVPTAYVSVNVQRAPGVYTMGNPLLAAKYRFYLPEVDGRRPALTIRARWAIPISPLNNIPPTQLGAEEFTFPANFTDTYAFLLEKTDLGLGFSAAWQDGMFYAGLQSYGDYYLPVSSAEDQSSFPTLSWGASVGVLPLKDLLGVYVEGRATSLLTGPTRTELFTYFGARAHFLDYLEAALWGALPIGSVARVSGIQMGLELRFNYDMPDAIRLGGGSGSPRSRDDILGE